MTSLHDAVDVSVQIGNVDGGREQREQADGDGVQREPGGNCITRGLPGKSILRDDFVENRTSRGALHKIGHFETYLR